MQWIWKRRDYAAHVKVFESNWYFERLETSHNNLYFETLHLQEKLFGKLAVAFVSVTGTDDTSIIDDLWEIFPCNQKLSNYKWEFIISLELQKCLSSSLKVLLQKCCEMQFACQSSLTFWFTRVTNLSEVHTVYEYLFTNFKSFIVFHLK